MMTWIAAMTTSLVFALVAGAIGSETGSEVGNRLTYPIVDTGQTHCFSNRGQLFRLPGLGQPFYGQDAYYQSNPPRYRDNHDGTVSDLNTGLMWQKTPDLKNKSTFRRAVAGAKNFRLAGYADWRLPTIKELYSLIDFNGCVTSRTPAPYIDTNYFDFVFGDTSKERFIDAQYWSSTEYVGTVMDGRYAVFGVNFADGRIKGYPPITPRGHVGRFVRYVRGNPDYGKNRLVDNRDGTITDLATGLMWTQTDNGKPLNWQQALAWAEGLRLAGHSDWRLPNAKELQSIVDYDRAPDATDSSQRGPAIDPMFKVTKTESYYWSGTTHLDGPRLGDRAVYVAFGRAFGHMTDPRTGRTQRMNVHGAGAQRSDPKSGNPADFPKGMGPQGDDRRIHNYARAVHSIDPSTLKVVKPSTQKISHVFPMRQGNRPPSHPRRPPRRGPPWDRPNY